MGWLGTTAGRTADGTFVAAVRFESEEAAEANSNRAEQSTWWVETQANFDGDAVFTNCPDVDTFGAGGSDDAGFVQIMTGRGDRDAVRPVAAELEATLNRMRPDVIGGTVGWPGDGTFVQVVYFTSEEDARKGESAEPSEEDREAMERFGSLMEFERFIDLPEPWLYSR
ncbi:MAG: hypothetical protein LC808_07135 [Actinobacteria bacterium]|nr:hypothetical protein [Actinomycetota bacterium]